MNIKTKKYEFMKLFCFDFDSTLVEHNYSFDAGEEEDEFMDSVESLQDEFVLKKSILKEYKKAKKDGSVLILLTNRSVNIKKEIVNILKEKGVTFDYHLFRKEDRSKGNRLENFLTDFKKDVDKVYFWDDKDKHIEDVKRISENFEDIKFKLNKVA